MSKVFVIGDIHGAYRALVQCLERSNFNKEKDTLISLGDIVDGWPEVDKVVEELLTIKNRVDIRGNHDEWFVEWIKTRMTPNVWTQQGGKETLECYLPILHGSAEMTKVGEKLLDKLIRHEEFFLHQHYYYVDDKNRLFVHGGYNWKIPFRDNDKKDMMWDRHLFETACQYENHNLLHPTEKNLHFREFREIFIGHTSTLSVGWRFKKDTLPLHVSNLWNLDTGAGWNGKLTIMNVDTKEYWQSEKVKDLYKNESNGRY